ncbi:MAG: MarR family winged helix-turn-helix transcriptional regulator [Roseiflexaceae bacterium]|nr:MarR family winged helix-turn-helix transcriptional regulator [Roseiflexaceae bacterium]
MDDDFTPLEQRAWGGLLGMHGRMLRWIDTDLHDHSRITHVEFEALLRLSWAEGHRLRIQDLAAQSVITRSGMSRVVERLERAGLLTREDANEDRRGAYAVLTEAGLTRLRSALHAHVVFVRRHFLEVFSDQELEQMGMFWRRVEEHQAGRAPSEPERKHG